MASTDARPVPQKNVAYRVTFPILDADGDLVTGAATLDSEVSKDGGTFADCTNEATEIATSSGVYFLDLTSTEMNADTVAVIVKTGTAGAKTTTIVMYPEEAGDIRVNVTQVAGTTQTAGDIIGDTNDIQARLPAALVSGRIDASVGAMAAGSVTAAAIATGAIDADALAADAVAEIRSVISGAADSGTTTTMVDAALTQADTDYWKGDLILFTSGTISGQCRLITGFTPATDTVTFSPATTQAVGTNTYEILPAGRADLALWLGTAMSALISGRVDANTQATGTGAITAGTFSAGALDAAALATDAANEIRDAVWAKAMTELASVPAVTGTVLDALNWCFTLARNKIEQTSTTQTLRKDDGTTALATSTHSDDGTTHTRGEFV